VKSQEWLRQESRGIMYNWKDALWFNIDKASKLRSMVGPGGAYDIKNGRVRLRDGDALAFDIPWLFVGETAKTCEFANRVYWQKFKVIPFACRHYCYKVVLSMDKVSQLMSLVPLLHHIWGTHGIVGKCGLDNRWYSSGNYKAFWYNDSVETGQICYEIVADTVQDIIEVNDSNLYLKKGCTEMEHPSFGGKPSDQWGEQTQEEADTEAALDEIFGQTETLQSQPAWLHNKIMADWVALAHGMKDYSYVEHTGKLLVDYEPVKYHETGGDEEDGDLVVVPNSEGEKTQGG
jgi:hypothetical protein